MPQRAGLIDSDRIQCVVRYPTALVVLATWPIAISCLGVYMALQERGHWTFRGAAVWAALGLISVLYMSSYRTEFTDSGVRQFGFLKRIRAYKYSDIQRVGIGKARSANAVTLIFTDGQRMTVYGAEGQLLKVRSLLWEKLPHLRGESVQT